MVFLDVGFSFIDTLLVIRVEGFYLYLSIENGIEGFIIVEKIRVSIRKKNLLFLKIICYYNSKMEF